MAAFVDGAFVVMPAMPQVPSSCPLPQGDAPGGGPALERTQLPVSKRERQAMARYNAKVVQRMDAAAVAGARFDGGGGFF